MKSITLLSSVLLLLLASCRSQEVAFQFQPATGKAAALALSASAAAPTPLPAVVAATYTAPAALAPRSRPAGIRRLLPHRPALHQTAARTTAARPPSDGGHLGERPQQPLLEHTGAFVLGVALIAGGVVGGILLGGWLGLGVGALVVLLGYYFVGVGIGGKHAWLEVFQEFFNM
ncbi:hypothetical protein KBK19_03150 [Microvirga sp. STR05]|uniref:DUF4870 domain-containing protein n=1 Tax=Hymenobacter duratus TaxID=2771356 RepID=A0ABR8JE91_9BACT|nr:hypothetical protein [Hymenobacter duratus]MBD2714026.1 hypothetical protein [Hymenobacter duratus]MBR7948928.1 hypothetical protein [Microvirga sp. STR05]